MPRGRAGICLPATNDGVDVNRIELDPVTAPPGALSGDYRGAAAKKRVEHDVAPLGAIQNRIRDQRDRLNGRMQCEQIALVAVASESVGAGIVPYVSAVAPELPELNVVAMAIAAVLEDEDKLVLAAIERA